MPGDCQLTNYKRVDFWEVYETDNLEFLDKDSCRSVL
jgi:hypothetical protein